jgi:hypothetical protein
VKAIHKITGFTWQEDGTGTCLARLAAADGTGTATGVDGEGKWLKQADFSTITCKVFNRTQGYATPDTAIATPTVTIASTVYDTPQTSKELWTNDDTGWNFRIDLGPTNFPDGNQIYDAEFKATLTGGTVFFFSFEAPTSPVHGS